MNTPKFKSSDIVIVNREGRGVVAVVADAFSPISAAGASWTYAVYPHWAAGKLVELESHLSPVDPEKLSSEQREQLKSVLIGWQELVRSRVKSAEAQPELQTRSF